jgi:tRNA pseudouridine55 synthase
MPALAPDSPMNAVPDLSGILLISKPSGPTSYDMIRWVKRAVYPTKIGHAGTLDPLASGLMILLFGKATRQQSTFMGLDKTYRCRMKLGIKTDTADITGTVTSTSPVPPITRDVIAKVFVDSLGPQSQMPPMYSALKVGGTPLYKLARKGKTVERKSRTITLHTLDLLDLTTDEIEFRVRCSSGTYVRTLVEDFAIKLGTVGTMTFLHREKIGDHLVEDAVPGATLRTMTLADVISAARPVTPL